MSTNTGPRLVARIGGRPPIPNEVNLNVADPIELDVSAEHLRSSLGEILVLQDEAAFVQHVKLTRRPSNRPVLSEARLFQKLALFPLTRLELNFESHAQMDCAILASTIRSCPSLRNLRISKTSLAGNAEDLGVSLQEHPLLKELILEDTKAAREDFSWSSLLGSISSSPSLKLVNFDPSRDSHGSIGRSISSLCSSASIKILLLSCRHLESLNPFVQSIFPALHQNMKLKALCLVMYISTQALKDSSLSCLGSMLEVNTTLVDLRMAFYVLSHRPWHFRNLLIPMLNALKSHNRSLRRLILRFSFYGGDWDFQQLEGTWPVQEFREMLRENTTLEQITLDLKLRNNGAFQRFQPPEALLKIISFYLKLNKLGRRRLLRGAAAQNDWVEVLLKGHKDVAVVYYLLSSNPSLLKGCNHEASALGESACPLMKKQKVVDF